MVSNRLAQLRDHTKFFDDNMEKPIGYQSPIHDPMASVIIPVSTGFEISERPLHAHWLATRGPSNWMGQTWGETKNLYRYWPNLKNINEEYAPELPDGTRITMTYMVAVLSGNSITPIGVTQTDRSPGVVLMRNLEKIAVGTHGLSRYNVTLVPLEVTTLSPERTKDVLFWWWRALRTFDWSKNSATLDTLVYWTDYYNRYFTECWKTSRTQINRTKSQRYRALRRDEVYAKPRGRRPSSVNSPRAIARKIRAQLSSIMEGPAKPVLKTMLHARGIITDNYVYADPLLGYGLLEQIQVDMEGTIPDTVSMHEVSDFFRTGKYIEAIGDDAVTHHRLNDILCKYPESIQNRLYHGVQVNLDPRQNSGEIIDGGRRYSPRGEQFLSYQKLRQPWPKPRRYTRSKV